MITELTPQEVNGLDLAFGAADVMKLMPKYGDIPQEFKTYGNKWVKVVDDWFFGGIKITKAVPKPGIEHPKAIRHIMAILMSWDPSSEHKTASCAYLLSLWYTEFEYTVRKTENQG